VASGIASRIRIIHAARTIANKNSISGNLPSEVGSVPESSVFGQSVADIGAMVISTGSKSLPAQLERTENARYELPHQGAFSRGYRRK
jgi:hypothetical protein